MALRNFNPITPSQRNLVLVDRSGLYKGGPVKALTEGLTKKGGRNNQGHITARRRGGGHKRRYRTVDFRRRKFDVPATVERIEYDPNRTAFIALLKYEDGEHIKDSSVDERLVQEAHARLLLSKQKKPPQECQVTVLEACQAYLENAKATRAEKTHSDRADTLFDFCFGFPSAYRSKEGSKVKRLAPEKKKEMARRRIHKGYGKLLVSQLRPLDIDQWLNVHKTWTIGGRRSRIQAIASTFVSMAEVEASSSLRIWICVFSREVENYLSQVFFLL